jgi:hypothetical protein
MASLFITGPITAIIAATVPGGQTVTLLEAAAVVYRTAKKVLRYVKSSFSGNSTSDVTPSALEIARRRSRGGSMDDVLLSPTSATNQRFIRRYGSNEFMLGSRLDGGTIGGMQSTTGDVAIPAEITGGISTNFEVGDVLNLNTLLSVSIGVENFGIERGQNFLLTMIQMSLLRSPSKAFSDWRYMHGLVMHDKSGRTSLTRDLRGREVIIIDLDEVVIASYAQDDQQRLQQYKASEEWSTFNLHVYAKAKEIVGRARENFPGKKLLLVSASLDLIEYLKVPESNIRVYSPTNTLWTQLSGALEEGARRIADNARQQLREKAGDKLRNFNTFDELYSRISDWMGVNRRP